MSRTFTTLQKRLSLNLLRLRKAAGFSQEALALEADIDRTYVSQIERCLGNPSLLVLCKLAKVLNVDVTEFLE